MRNACLLIALAIGLVATGGVWAQQPTSGTLLVSVWDADKNPVVDASVVLIGPGGKRELKSDAAGIVEARFLPTGKYTLRISKDDFATIETSLTIGAGQRTSMPIVMVKGQTDSVTVTATAPLIDAKRTEVITSFSTESLDTIAVGRKFTDALAFAPGVVSGLGTGNGNYSISGSSGLENSYIIEGVNVTDSGFGGVGSYNRNFNAIGTGVTTEFLEEVQVKTAGFEAEYGQALGGVITATVKSGSNDISGAVKAYFSPPGLEATPSVVVLEGGVTNVRNNEGLDYSVQAGGPFWKDRLFWFVSYNPVEASADFFRPAGGTAYPTALVSDGTALNETYNGAVTGTQMQPGGIVREAKQQTDNYAAKFSWYMTPNHRVDVTAFGDPSDGNGGLGTAATNAFDLDWDIDGDGVLDGSRQAADVNSGGLRSSLTYGADSQSLKYVGVFGGNYFLEAQLNHRKNEIDEISVVDDFLFTDVRILNTYGENFVPRSGGFGALFPSTDETWEVSAKFTAIAGGHEIKAGVGYWDLEYQEGIQRTFPPQPGGGPVVLNFPDGAGGFIPVAVNSGLSVQVRNGIPGSTGSQIPLYRAVRGNFNPIEPTLATEFAVFAQDTWSINDKWTLKFGLRATQQELEGSGSFTLNLTRVNATTFNSNPTVFTAQTYKFDWELSPRLGVSFDPRGDGRGKLYMNLARYFERVPQDVAVRAFSNEVGTSRYEARDPDFTTYVTGSTVNLQGLAPTRVEDGTKLPYVDEVVLGWQQLLTSDLSVEIRGIYRNQGRTLEDVQFTSQEEISNYYYYDPDGDGISIPGGELYPGVGAAGFGEYVLANPGDNTPNNVAFPFPSPVRKYRAIEVVLNKRLSNNWLLNANYRYSRLKGNYEGLYRNDNTQEDPNITSLFDFPCSPVMRGQCDAGILPTDRTNVLNAMGTYFWGNGLEAGGSLRWGSGVPRTALLAHPNYQNAGEIPGINPIFAVHDDANDVYVFQSDCNLAGGGASSHCQLYDYEDAPRGSLGRTNDSVNINLHGGYKLTLPKRMLMKFNVDVFNLFNEQQPVAFDDNIEVTAATLNPNYGRITGYQSSRTIRVGAAFEW